MTDKELLSALIASGKLTPRECEAFGGMAQQVLSVPLTQRQREWAQNVGARLKLCAAVPWTPKVSAWDPAPRWRRRS